jgi:hypothetical protein
MDADGWNGDGNERDKIKWGESIKCASVSTGFDGRFSAVFFQHFQFSYLTNASGKSDKNGQNVLNFFYAFVHCIILPKMA